MVLIYSAVDSFWYKYTRGYHLPGPKSKQVSKNACFQPIKNNMQDWWQLTYVAVCTWIYNSEFTEYNQVYVQQDLLEENFSLPIIRRGLL